MSADPLAMSLDEIITSNKTKRVGSKRGRGRGGVSKRSQATPYTAPKRPVEASLPLAEVSKIIVSNLAPNVTQKDLHDLFSRVGSVRSAILNHNSAGKSAGSGTVVFTYKTEALKAVSQYNGRAFDGKPMNVELILSGSVAASATLGSRLGPIQQQIPISGRGQTRGRGRRPRGGRGRTHKSEDALNADMDAYMKDEDMVDV